MWHNGLGYDFDVMERFFPGVLKIDRLIDTLVLARLAHPEERNHSLRAWGEKTGTMKGEYKGDFSVFDEELQTYAKQDVPAGRALFHKVKHVLDWGECVELEHRFARLMVLQERFGFPFNVKKAEELDLLLRAELDAMGAELQATFPPIERTAIFTPKVNNKARGYQKGVPFTKRWSEPFNPASRAHVAERLQILGWKPKAYGDNGVPTVDEKILSALPYPEARVLTRMFRLQKQLGMLSEGKSAWLKAVKPDGRIHGRVNPNGAVTGRCTHSNPNVAQADKKDKRMRELFEAPAGMVLVGCDAEGLEARTMAHFMARWDGGRYARIILEGSKSDKTDVHSLNLKALIKAGLIRAPKDELLEKWERLRDGAKTILYAAAFGAKDRKLGSTLGQLWEDNRIKDRLRVPPAELGALVRKAVGTAMVGFNELNEAAQKRAKARGYLVGIDGRQMPVRSPHAALNVIAQGSGSVVMKKATVLLYDRALERGWVWGRDFAFVAHIHDEVESAVVPEIAKEYADLAEDCIRAAGEHFNIRCQLAGKAAIGKNWAEVH